jgi:acyl phosphate:glycerol-3-phosphate acyltransferase
MRGVLPWTAVCAAGFLIGSIPVGLLWGKVVRGIDVRQHGSGNLGATNVYRVLGPGHGIAVLLLDVGKGCGAVLFARWLVGVESAALASGLLAVLGHMFSPWVRFRGGKGVATGLGIWLVLAPAASLLALGIWGLLLALTRRVSIASLAASTALVPIVLMLPGQGARLQLAALSLVAAVLVWIRHRGNIGRLLRGEEPPLWGARP